MAQFNSRFTHEPEPSDLGETFLVGTKVFFKLNGSIESGFVTKQLGNAAIVDLAPSDSNGKLLTHVNGHVVVSYQELHTHY